MGLALALAGFRSGVSQVRNLVSNGTGTIFTAADAKTETDMSSVTKNNLLLVINDNRYLECLLCLFVFTSSFNVTGPISRETCFAVVVRMCKSSKITQIIIDLQVGIH